MSEHKAIVAWKLDGSDFSYDVYNREHTWAFEGGARIEASAAPRFKGKPDYVDPEEAFVAALSSCHMLTFLALASKKRLLVSSYRDEAVGHLEPNGEGQLSVTRVVLHPQVTFAGERLPEPDEVEQMHERAHNACFIANSVRTEVTIDPRAA
jgi:organic hydroperoxide reductase OsmC/OhrA